MQDSPNDVVHVSFPFVRGDSFYVQTRDGRTYKVVVGVGLDLVPIKEDE